MSYGYGYDNGYGYGECSYCTPYNYGRSYGGYALILVLFILLVIIGASRF